MSGSPSRPAPTRRGVVKWYDAGAGRGFLRRDDGPDVEVRAEWLTAPGGPGLVEGEAVEFELLKTHGGFRSRSVRVLGPAPDDPFAGQPRPDSPGPDSPGRDSAHAADHDPTTG